MAAERAARLESTFEHELAERIQALSGLLAQGGADSELARQLHSLKGAARAVGNAEIEQLAHAAESAAQAGDRDEVARLVARLNPARVPEPVVDMVRPSAPQPAEPISIVAARAEHATPDKARDRTQDSGSVRVAVGKLDTLLTESGELSVTHLRVAQRLAQLRELQGGIERWQRDWRKSRPVRARLRRAESATHARDLESMLRMVERADQELQRILHDAGDLVAALSQTTAQLGAVAGAIGQEVMNIRLLPAGTVFIPLERVVRDISRQTGKEARLVLTGTDTEVDRRILDELRDPLMHMVRNTIDHGIEAPADRAAAGKPAQGTLTLSAAQRGDRVLITVEDDGRGLDVEAIRATAVRRGLLSAERAENLDLSMASDLIFHPGFTTRASVSEISGRGVGMDVVRSHVERLGGEIRVQTSPGLGTAFTITVPLTLATTRVLLVEDSTRTYAVPSATIERTGRVRATDLLRLEGRRAIQIDGRPVPVVELGDVLQRPRTADDGAVEDWRPYFVLSLGDRSVALLTDRLIDEQELVVKALGAPLKRVRHVGGAAVLSTGAVVVILNPSDLTKTALGNLDSGHASLRHFEQRSAEADAPRRRIMVADDSVMTRTLERSILEAAGYDVVVASDGMQALELLRETPVDAVVSDVEMPRMSGLELTAAIRQDEALRHLPVVLVTSLDTPEHVERGAAAGADAYIVKGRFDQNDLLQTVGRLL